MKDQKGCICIIAHTYNKPRAPNEPAYEYYAIDQNF